MEFSSGASKSRLANWNFKNKRQSKRPHPAAGRIGPLKIGVDLAGIEPASESLFIGLLPSQSLFCHSLGHTPGDRLMTSVAS